jgi:holo-ACP synthase
MNPMQLRRFYKVSMYFKGEEQSLDDILRAREVRVQNQNELLNKYGSTIISYKLNIPGPIKYNSLIKHIYDEGLLVLRHKIDEYKIPIFYEKEFIKNSGPEYLAAVDMPAALVKKITTSIEESHALGRLYDFDVLDEKGMQISREELGIDLRKCLL